MPNNTRIDRKYLLNLRYTVQWALFAFILWGGVKFYIFAEHFLTGKYDLITRPPLVEGFLPIGSLMSLKLWLTSGIIDNIHPAGMVIFGAAIIMSATLKKSFCGWICPIGTLSELLHRTGKRIFGRNFTIHKYIDYPLRSLKYILMGFFLFIVLVAMDNKGLLEFMDTPYWKVSDVKMLYFFTNMTSTTAISLVVLVALSVLTKNFWCRYLCPYGALVGLVSYLSPVKIRRDADKCINCHLCSRHCPQQIDVQSKLSVNSPECTGCLTCVGRCPAEGALDMGLSNKKPLNPLIYAGAVLVVFFGIILAAQLSGHWESSVTYEEYINLIPAAHIFDHP